MAIRISDGWLNIGPRMEKSETTPPAKNLLAGNKICLDLILRFA